MNAVPTTAMIMSAGLGTRMRPLTDCLPKPLIQVNGKALLDHALERLGAAGVRKVVINVHYLADIMEAHLKQHDCVLEIVISDERDLLLETGGGMVAAEPLIDCDPFLALNSDNLWIDGAEDTLRQLAAQWDGNAMDAVLLLVPRDDARNNEGRGDFHLEPDGRVRRRGPDASAPYVFTGIQIVAKRLLRDAPKGAFSTNLLWDRAIAEGRCFGAIHDGLWFDVGTPAAIGLTEAALRHG